MPTDPHTNLRSSEARDGDAPAFPELSGSGPVGAEALRTENVLWTAQFAPVTAWAMALQWFVGTSLMIVMLAVIPIVLVPCIGVMIAGVVLVLAWFGLLTLAKLYVASLRCVLTTRSVRAGGGVMFKWERSVPLDKITDVTMSQGPIARMFEVEHLMVETAGGGSGPGQSSAIPLFGVKSPREFRRAVLEQRDRVVGTAEGRDRQRFSPQMPLTPAPAAPSAPADESVREILLEIRDELRALRAERGPPENA